MVILSNKGYLDAARLVLTLASYFLSLHTKNTSVYRQGNILL